ncbi:sugar glycosyltransferase [Pigmentiphaga soli]|uniref:Sugar glycosyltransferase n=1 Tax=Pigmentiphaga soli TaxID=1007095 RepID=A0ABP8GL09_9BURK
MPVSRRLANTALKLLYRYSHGPRYRHNERLWPHVAVDRDADGNIAGYSYRGRPLPLANTELARGAASGMGHIIASGPSINEIDYGRLSLSHVMGVNGAIALADRHPVRFDYYCFNDTGFVRARPGMVRRIVAQDLLLFTTPLCLWHVLQLVPPEALRCRLFLVENPQWRAWLPARTMAEVRRDHSESELAIFDLERALGFGHDIRKGVFDVGTVAYTALQIMAWLGFTEIVLHGVDLVDAAAAPRFYESAADRLPTTLDAYLPGHILPSFVQAAALLRESGVQIVNLSPRGALSGDMFRQLDWHTLAGG